MLANQEGFPCRGCEFDVLHVQEIVLDIEPQEYLCRAVVTIIPVSQLSKHRQPKPVEQQQQTAQQVSAFSSPFAQHPFNDSDPSDWPDQDLQQPLLRSPSQLPSTAPSTSDVRLTAIPENAPASGDAESGPSDSHMTAQQVLRPSVCFTTPSMRPPTKSI